MEANYDPRVHKYDYKGMDVESLKRSIGNHMERTVGKDVYTATLRDWFFALARVVRDRLIERWMETQRTYYREDAKRIYYLSLEFLIGRSLDMSLVNMGIEKELERAVEELGYSYEEIQEMEEDAGLGNGGLGRLAACLLESMSTLGIPGYGYGIRYEYGLFYQQIKDGQQVEHPDNWLRYGNPWEFPRPEVFYQVNFYGRVERYMDESGKEQRRWVDHDEVMAMAYDMPVPGYSNSTANNLRLWAAKASRDFDLQFFNYGHYIKAVERKNNAENISKILYPNDNFFVGKELRLRQEYFCVSATLQDILYRYKKYHNSFNKFPDKIAIQLNDTHPSIAIAELMRVFLDNEGLGWEEAWDITVKTFGYTNHTILPEAMEKWSVELLGYVLPRHLEIIYEINHRFLEEVAGRYPGDVERLRRMSIIEEGEVKRVRMAHLAIIGSHKVNGVAALHSEILKESVFKDFHEFYPDRFINITNGITPRLWLKKSNRGLSELITRRIGRKWITDLSELEKLIPSAEDKTFREEWRAVKRRNKEALANIIHSKTGVNVDIDSMFDVQVKRIHEYKRQLLNILHVITMYNRLRAAPGGDFIPRTVIFGGKAAPGYKIAKEIISLINAVADVVNNDPATNGRLKVVFLLNYNVSLACRIFPAADLSEQISTAGTEASGTGNMKFALNGALTIGTMDGANIEMAEELGEDNMFIFGLRADEIEALKREGYAPRDYYRTDPELKQAIDMIAGGFFPSRGGATFDDITKGLLDRGDQYFLLADYADYVGSQKRVSLAYRNKEEWTRKSILNVAKMGKFSSDRTIQEYSQKIWGVNSVEVTLYNDIYKRPLSEE